MSWTCAACEQKVLGTGTCPTCGAMKTSWTVVADHTRTLSVARKAVTLLRGADGVPRPPGDPALAAVRLEPAPAVPALSRADAADVAAQGLLPATADTLFIALRGAGKGRVRVTLELLFSARPSMEVELQGPVPADGHVKVLFVHGPAGAGAPAFEGVHVVDAGEDTPDGVAPTVEVSALGCPAQAVALAAAPSFPLSV